MLNSQPKCAAWRSEDYLAWIRTWPCIRCGDKAEAHHEPLGAAGTAIKVPDSHILPLCHYCHRVLRHVEGPDFWKGYDVKMLIIWHLTEYLKYLEEKKK